MIAWSILAARNANIFDHIIVSTDDSEIAEISEQFGAIAPFVRPTQLSDDFTPTAPVIAHAIDWAENALGVVGSVCCIYATAPLIQPDDLTRAAEVLDQTDADYVFPVTSFAFPIQRGMRLTDNGRMEMLHPEHALTRSQDLEEAYHDVGQFYWGQRDAWAQGRTIFSPNSVPIIIERHRAQDIDTPEDLKRAEVMFRVISEMKTKAL